MKLTKSLGSKGRGQGVPRVEGWIEVGEAGGEQQKQRQRVGEGEGR